MASMLEFRTPQFNPYAVKYSPYFDSRIAVAASSNFGIVGNGRLFVLGLTPNGIQIEKTFDTNDAQYDLSWSEINENQLVVACGDGSIKLFDLGVSEFPIMNFHEHKRECFSVCWSPTAKDTFISSSWDGTVKVWSPTRPDSLRTLPVGACAYSVAYSPHNPMILSAVAADSHVRVFDLRTPSSAQYHMTAKIPVHMTGGAVPVASAPPTELLTHDWNKYREGVIATAGVDRVIRTFDIRNPAGGPLAAMHGHEYAVRRLAWSPHAGDILISGSYDMTCRVWTDASTVPPDPTKQSQSGIELGQMNRHTEFVTGVDWCLFGDAASTTIDYGGIWHAWAFKASTYISSINHGRVGYQFTTVQS